MFALQPQEPVLAEIRRVSLELIEDAVAKLATHGPDSADGVHDARKDLKKLRSLLRLTRGCLPKSFRRHCNGRLRVIGRQLAPLREAVAHLECLDKASAEIEHRMSPETLGELRQELLARVALVEQTTPVIRSRAALLQTRSLVDDWLVCASGWDALGPGFGRSYRRMRRAFRMAQNNPDAHSIHQLRKRLKDHYYHVSLLGRCWTEALPERAGRLKGVSEQLGDHHDLELLKPELQRALSAVAPSQASADLASVLADRQHRLWAQAAAACESLCAPRPRELSASAERAFCAG